jgi:hypothetical protein
MLTIFQVNEIFIPDRSHHGDDEKQKTNHKMKITIRHDQQSIDPSATYTDEQFAQVKKSLEREYTTALIAQYPDAEIEFEESAHTKSIIVKTSGLDDPSEIEDNIQRITETVFETGLFWL